jgi:hypothetical protein
VQFEQKFAYFIKDLLSASQSYKAVHGFIGLETLLCLHIVIVTKWLLSRADGFSAEPID